MNEYAGRQHSTGGEHRNSGGIRIEIENLGIKVPK